MKYIVRFCLVVFCIITAGYTGALSESDEESFYTFIDGSKGVYMVEGPQFLIDGDLTTKWCRKMDGECYVIFKTKIPVSINGYMLIKANDEDINPDRSPLQWTLYGANSASTPKRNDNQLWKIIDKHDAQSGRSMSESVNWNSYAFVTNESIPAYKYFMLVINRNLGGQYMQLSELKLICDNTLEVSIVATENPKNAIVAMGKLQYDDTVFELITSDDIYSDTIILGGSLSPIKKADEKIVRLKLKDEENWPQSSSVSITITSAYDIHEKKVSKLKYSQLYIISK